MQTPYNSAINGDGLSERFFLHKFENGLTFVAEELPAMQSAAMTLMLAAGAAGDPIHRCGSATVLADLVLRGAGDRDSRQLTDYLDSLGLQRAAGVGVHHARFGCAGMAARVVQSLEVYADIVRRPRLPQDGFAAAVDLAMQSLAGLEDDPRQKLLVKLRERFLPSPLGRNPTGNPADLAKLTLAICRADWQRRYQPHEAILSVAGNIHFPAVRDEIGRRLGDWAGSPPPALRLTPPGKPVHHERQESEQTHIGIAYPSVPETDSDYYVVRLAIEALSGGMSGRLFTEIREKRGLCYSVWAGYTATKEMGGILAYAGSSNERAQATLDCLIGEIHRLAEGITAAELDRAKTGLKAATIMQGESTSARAGAIAHDYFMRGRVRTLDEIKSQIDRVSVERVNEYLKRNAPGPFTIVTVGPKALSIG
jgi:predicted Zn-dependent peptidase